MATKAKKYDNTNKGAAWMRAKKSDKHPNVSGTVDVDGEQYWISVWLSEDALKKLAKGKKAKKGAKPVMRFCLDPKD